MCHTNYCNVVSKHVKLTFGKKYCSECGRKLISGGESEGE